MKKGKSVLRWWSILADNYGWLWKNNLLYLLCLLPSVICGFLFFLFHAYLFLAIAVAGLILAGPGVLATHQSVLYAALETPRTVRISFWSLYRKFFRMGCRLGSILAAGIILIGMPIYYALSITSGFFPALLCLGGMWLLLWLGSSMQVLSHLCSGEKFLSPKLLRKIFAPGVVCVVFGLAQFAWICLCCFVPAFAGALALLGLPTVIRFSILYDMYDQGDKDE